MISEEKIRSLIAEKIIDTDLFVVDIVIDAANKIKVEIDADGGMPISGCVDVSRHIESNLDREKEDFALEVSTPGLDKPFKVKRQYQKNIGRKVEVKLNNNTTVEGQLKAADDQKINLFSRRKEKNLETKKREWKEFNNEYTYEEIKETKVIISFK